MASSNPLPSAELAADPERFVAVRTVCPACGEAAGRTLCDLAWDAPETAAFRDHPNVRFYRFLPLLMQAFPYRLRECAGCGLLWQPHVLTAEAERRWYAGGVEEHRPGIRTEKWAEPRRKLRYYTGVLELASQVSPLFPERPPEELRVLDFGAGWGYLGGALRALGHRVDAAELDPAKRRHLESLGFACCELPCERRWDAVVSDQVFEHLAEPAAAMRLLRDHLEPGGGVLVSVPTVRRRGLEAALAGGDVKTLLVLFPFLHVNLFSREALLALGRGAGLEPAWPPAALESRLDRLAPSPARRLGERGRRIARNALAALRPSARRLFRGVQAFRLPG